MRLIGLLVATLWILGGCGSSTSQQGETTPAPDLQPAPTPPTPEPTPPAPQPIEVSVRIIHAAATAATKNIGVTYATGGTTPGGLASDLAFRSATGYTSATLTPGSTGIGLSASAEGFDPLTVAEPITAGEPHTAIVFSRPDSATALQATVLRDAAQAPDAGKTRVRFFHAVVGWNDVDVCAPGATARDAAVPVFPAARYGQLAGSQSSLDRYIDMPAGVTKLQVREAKPDAPCTGRVLGAVDVTPPAGASVDAANVTLVAVGRGTGRPAVPRAVLMCLDSPAQAPSCSALPMRAR
jgi:hypothetical protein